jgi:hypothetical protein
MNYPGISGQRLSKCEILRRQIYQARVAAFVYMTMYTTGLYAGS